MDEVKKSLFDRITIKKSEPKVYGLSKVAFGEYADIAGGTSENLGGVSVLGLITQTDIYLESVLLFTEKFNAGVVYFEEVKTSGSLVISSAEYYPKGRNVVISNSGYRGNELKLTTSNKMQVEVPVNAILPIGSVVDLSIIYVNWQVAAVANDSFQIHAYLKYKEVIN